MLEYKFPWQLKTEITQFDFGKYILNDIKYVWVQQIIVNTLENRKLSFSFVSLWISEFVIWPKLQVAKYFWE